MNETTNAAAIKSDLQILAICEGIEAAVEAKVIPCGLTDEQHDLAVEVTLAGETQVRGFYYADDASDASAIAEAVLVAWAQVVGEERDMAAREESAREAGRRLRANASRGWS